MSVAVPVVTSIVARRVQPVVLSSAVLHAAGPYVCENIHVEGRAVMTNTPPSGAFRGFGAPQTHFASERHMDRIAERLGLDPIDPLKQFGQ